MSIEAKKMPFNKLPPRITNAMSKYVYQRIENIYIYIILTAFSQTFISK